MPKEFGGLGIPNLRRMNLALRVRCLWLSRVEASRPWKEFDIQVPQMVDLRSRDLLGGGRWCHHFLLAGPLVTGWATKGPSAAPL
jgi:hypothetical protein